MFDSIIHFTSVPTSHTHPSLCYPLPPIPCPGKHAFLSSKNTTRSAISRVPLGGLCRQISDTTDVTHNVPCHMLIVTTSLHHCHPHKWNESTCLRRCAPVPGDPSNQSRKPPKALQMTPAATAYPCAPTVLCSFLDKQGLPCTPEHTCSSPHG